MSHSFPRIFFCVGRITKACANEGNRTGQVKAAFYGCLRQHSQRAFAMKLLLEGILGNVLYHWISNGLKTVTTQQAPSGK